MKKKSLLFTFVFAVAMIFLISLAFSQTNSKTKAENQLTVRVKNSGTNTELKVNTQYGYKHGFIDEDGDGINDYAKDDDGDGIPNGQDPDYQRPMDGTGYKHMYGKNRNNRGMRFSSFSDQSFNNWGGGNGTGVCDGSGPKGKAHRKGRGGR